MSESGDFDHLLDRVLDCHSGLNYHVFEVDGKAKWPTMIQNTRKSPRRLSARQVE
jgi:hypothetical protein